MPCRTCCARAGKHAQCHGKHAAQRGLQEPPPAATGDEARQLRQRAEDLLDQAQERFAGARDEIVRRGKVATRATDEWVHDNPWGAIGVGAALGLVVGFLIARR